MTDDSKDLVPEILRVIRLEAAATRNELVTTRNELHQDNRMLHERMSVFEKHMSALVSASAYQEERFTTIEDRLH
jgi:hypothetical protein